MIKRIWPSAMIVNSFRSFENIQFQLGRNITLISGQNGSGKSNLLSLIASASGVQKKSRLGSNFQPDFNDFFVIDPSEKFSSYKLFVDFSDDAGTKIIRKKLSFKDDTKSNRGIRIIPRTYRFLEKEKRTLRSIEKDAEDSWGVGGAARVPIPTIYLSLSRVYPLGEKRDNIKIRKITTKNFLYKNEADKMFAKWYNAVIPNSIVEHAQLSIIEKSKISKRSSFHMDMSMPALSQSIGQDNLGNIISAFVDIYILSLEADYQGALICIDEIDVSLHPDSQIRLFNLMVELSKQLNIQFVVTSHSLTFIKELSRKVVKCPTDYKIVYLKNPSHPYITQNTDYYSLKADLFNQINFQPPLTKVYFEDEVGKRLFKMLFEALMFQLNEEKGALACFKRSKKCEGLVKKLETFKNFGTIFDKLNLMSIELGCEELIKISEVDTYFKRVIVVLDGDARIKNGPNVNKPQIKDYLHDRYVLANAQERLKPINVCFFPSYFPPESFLYKILHILVREQVTYCDFWRSLDFSEKTQMYTPDKISEMLNNVGENFNNDDLKKIFRKSLWSCCDNIQPLNCYYSDENVKFLIDFWESFLNVYNIARPLTLQNRYD